jgi:ornithine carbamoyltransferase
MSPRHLLSLGDCSREEIEDLFGLAARIKAAPRSWARALEGRCLAMLFQKPSTRTRVSFEVGMFQLGGSALYLGAGDVQLRRGETVADTARVLSRYVDAIMARVHAHQDVVDLARHGTVPVINGLSDRLHPCQALADYFTLWERRAGSLKGAKLAYVGDGNNVCHELLLGAGKLGVTIAVACPPGYGPDAAILEAARLEAERVGEGTVTVTGDPASAVAGADVVYTDVWTSMGQEDQGKTRRKAFAGFQVTPELMAAAAPDGVFMHCLPAHRGEEVSAEVIDGPRSVVFDEAENRLHTQKALLVALLPA